MTQMTRATYNITTNRFKVYPVQDGTRLTDEEQAGRSYGKFNWYPGQKCFSAIYSPQAEDWIHSFGVEIVEDDTPDDLEARVDRFSKYAANDERDAASAYARAAEANTARRLRLAQGTAASKAEEAEYWQGRIAGAIAHAAYKDKPEVIARRIKGIEADKRKQIKLLEADTLTLQYWTDPDKELTHARAMQISNARNCGSYCFKKDEYPASDYEGQQSIWSALEDNTCTPQQAQALEAARLNACLDRESRWIAHYDRRLEYERAYLAAVGGADLLAPQPKAPRRVRPALEDGIKKGSVISYPMGYYGQGERYIGTVVSIGAANVRVTVPDYHSSAPYYAKKGLQIVRRLCRLATESEIATGKPDPAPQKAEAWSAQS